RPVHFVHDRFTARTPILTAGQVVQFYIPSDLFTDALTIKITEIVREGTPNAIFGDDVFVMGVDAPTSFAVHRIAPDAGGAFVAQDTTFTIDNPQTGLVRLAVQGDWTNGGRVSARVTIERTRRLPTLPSAVGQIQQDDEIPYSINVPAGTAQAV